VRLHELDALGMGIDFKVLKEKVNGVVDELDHCDLNEHPTFQDRNPSSENIAAFLFDQLAQVLNSDRSTLYSIEVRETDTSGVIYYGV
jgi:6-pyruvoyltetrahydropterin/6-carboxytetrahydropterin synthase